MKKKSPTCTSKLNEISNVNFYDPSSNVLVDLNDPLYAIDVFKNKLIINKKLIKKTEF